MIIDGGFVVVLDVFLNKISLSTMTLIGHPCYKI